MALPILSTLSKAVRRVYPIVRKGVRLGLSGNEIQNALIAADMGVARAPLLRLIKAERESKDLNSQLKFVGLDRMPNIARLAPAKTKILRKLSYTVLINAFDDFIGETVDTFITISTDVNMTRRQLEQKAQDIFEADNKRYPLQFIAKQLIEGMVAGVLGTIK